jgi:hypothetical protein
MPSDGDVRSANLANPLWRIAEHFGGLVAVLICAWVLGGWPARLIVIGAWLVVTTMGGIYMDSLRELLRKE